MHFQVSWDDEINEQTSIHPRWGTNNEQTEEFFPSLVLETVSLTELT